MSSLSGNVKNRNAAVSPPAYPAGGDRVADERAWADAYEAAGLLSHAEAHRRQAELIETSCGRTDPLTVCAAHEAGKEATPTD